jgi:hypothetical protein
VPNRTLNPITKHVVVIRRSLIAIDRWLGRLVALTNRAGRGGGERSEKHRYDHGMSERR